MRSGGGTLAQLNVQMGEQRLSWGRVSAGDTTASDFDRLVGTHADVARLGVYLHFLQDRVSHNLCSDAAQTATAGPNLMGDYTVAFDDEQCNAPIHALRHVWEVGAGYDPNQLEQREQTTEQALRVTYRELQVFAEHLGVARAELPPEDDLIADLLVVLQVPDASARVDAMEQLFDAWGVAQLPYSRALDVPSQ